MRKIGLLGGSFNPAHEGHLHLSLHAKKALQLDEIWWLVSPQNPLKSCDDMADYDTRLASAKRLSKRHPCIKISEIEQQNGLQYTVDTVQFLSKKRPFHHYVWLMGADNLAQFHRWHRWRDIAATLPIAVCDRAPFSHSALRQKSSQALAKYRVNSTSLPKLPLMNAPAWAMLSLPRHPASSTALRKKLGKIAFLGHN